MHLRKMRLRGREGSQGYSVAELGFHPGLAHRPSSSSCCLLTVGTSALSEVGSRKQPEAGAGRGRRTRRSQHGERRQVTSFCKRTFSLAHESSCLESKLILPDCISELFQIVHERGKSFGPEGLYSVSQGTDVLCTGFSVANKCWVLLTPVHVRPGRRGCLQESHAPGEEAVCWCRVAVTPNNRELSMLPQEPPHAY